MSSNQGGCTYDLVFRHSTEPFQPKCKKRVREDSIIGHICQCPDYSLFLEMIINSGYYNMLNNPLTTVSIFIPRNSVFMNLSDNQLNMLKNIDVRTFVGNHISTDILDKNQMIFSRHAIQTKSGVMLEVNGLGLVPKVGGFSKSLKGTPSQWLVSSVTHSINVRKSVINIIDLPIFI